MEGEYEIVPTNDEIMCEIVSKNEEDLCALVLKCEEDRIEIVPKSEKDPCEMVPKTEEDLSKMVIELEEIKRETVTLCEGEQYKAMWRNEKDLYDSTLPEGLEIKPSSLLRGALGAFTFLKIEKNFRFGPYIGERLELHEKERAFKSQHCWLVSNF